MNSMKDRYESFAKMCVPEDTPEHYKILIEHAFYGGALELINGIGEAKRGNEKEVSKIIISDLFREVIQFGINYVVTKLGRMPKGSQDVQP